MRRLSAALGDRAELWIKREDLGAIAFAGNKLRNLEFLLAAAQVAGADTVVTSGRRWSNHCRLTAAAGTMLGLEVHTVLSGMSPDGAHSGSPNVALIEQFGGIVHPVTSTDRADRDARVEAVAAELAAAGRRVEVIPVGGSGAIGAWGQVLGAVEVVEQAAGLGFVPDAIVLPSASGGTQAGLTVGTSLAALETPAEGAPIRVLGVVVARPESELRQIVERIVGELAVMAGIAAPLDRIELEPAHIGGGYGLPTAAADEATHLLARTEGVLVDPVYTAKGAAGLIAGVRAGAFDGRRVVFWHGGGLPSLFEPLGRSA